METREQPDGSVVVVLAGELDIASAPSLNEALAAIADRGVVLDLRQLDFIDSTGLHSLVKADRRAREAGKPFVIVRGRQQVQRVFDVTGVGQRLEIVEE